MRARLSTLVAVAALLLAGCGNLLDTAAAVVDGHKITIAQVSEALDEFKSGQEYERLSQQGNIAAIERQVQQAILSELVRRAVLEPEAEELGIEVTDEEVAEQIERIKADFGSQSAFEEGLKESGFTLERLETRIRDNLLEDKLRAEVTADAAPSEEEVRAFYDENLDDFTEVYLQHILVEDPALAQRIAKQLQAPKAQRFDYFARFARKYSTHESSRSNEGQLDFDDAGAFGPAFEKEVTKLKPGETSDPIATDQGYHVVRLLEEILSFEEVRERISEELAAGVEEETWHEWLIEVYEAADIRINSRYGELDIETQVVVDATAEDVPGAVSSPSPSPSLTP